MAKSRRVLLAAAAAAAAASASAAESDVPRGSLASDLARSAAADVGSGGAGGRGAGGLRGSSALRSLLGEDGLSVPGSDEQHLPVGAGRREQRELSFLSNWLGKFNHQNPTSPPTKPPAPAPVGSIVLGDAAPGPATARPTNNRNRPTRPPTRKPVGAATTAATTTTTTATTALPADRDVATEGPEADPKPTDAVLGDDGATDAPALKVSFYRSALKSPSLNPPGTARF